MSGFKSYSEDFDRVFFTEQELVDQFVGTSLYTWGYNVNGQLGTGTTTDSSSPGTVSGAGITWKQVSLGFRTSVAIKTDGTLWTWGQNLSGQLGDNTTTDRSSPGTVSGAGTTWKQVDSGIASTVALKTDGILWTWGANGYGQLGDGSVTFRSSPGTVSGAGTTWKQVSAGDYFSAAVKIDGTLWTFGRNDYGQLGDGSTTNRSSPGTTSGGGTSWKQVSGGVSFTAAVKTDGTLWTWGYNVNGQLGNGSTTSRSSPGTVSGAGTTWKQVSAGASFTAAVKTDGTLWTWGYNAYAQLGNNSQTDRSSPGTTSGGGTTWKQVSSGQGIPATHAAAVKTDGTLWTWGHNNVGQLGDGSTDTKSSPVTTSIGGTNWKYVSAKSYLHTAAISDN